MIRIRAQHAQVIEGGLDRNLRFSLGVLGDFQIFLRDGAFIEKNLGAIELRVRQRFVGEGLLVIGVRPGDIGALHFHQELALGHGISQAGEDLDDAAGRQRNHRNVSRHIGADHAGHFQFGRRVDLARDASGNLPGSSTLKKPAPCTCSTWAGGGASALGSPLPCALQPASNSQAQPPGRVSQFEPFHWITSRPTARFN